MIKSCPNCKSHKYQDEKYGNKMRVYTSGSKPEHRKVCTVCGAEAKVAVSKK